MHRNRHMSSAPLNWGSHDVFLFFFNCAALKQKAVELPAIFSSRNCLFSRKWLHRYLNRHS